MDLRSEHTELFVSRNTIRTGVTGRRSLHPIDYSLHCTKIWGPPAREAPYEIFMHHGNIKSRAARGKTNPTSSKAVSTPRFV